MLLVLLCLSSQTLMDFQVNNEDYSSKKVQWMPVIACYDSGGSAMWRDMRLPSNGMRAYGVRLDSDGDTVGKNFSFDDDSALGGCLGRYAIDCDFQGNYTGVWIQHYDAVARRFSQDGTPLGSSFVVDNATTECANPAVAIDSAGRTVIVWADRRTGNAQVYCQMYDESGTAVGTNFPVSDSLQYMSMRCDVAISAQRSFVVVWEYHNDIWGQRFDSLGNPIGSNFKIWNDTLDIIEDYPAVSSTHDGHFAVVWGMRYRGNILCRIFDSTYTPVSNIIQVNEPQLTQSTWPKVTAFSDSMWCITWDDSAANIYLQRITKEGTLMGSNIRINSTDSVRNNLPDVDVTEEYIFVTYTRKTYHMWDIMIQQIAPDGTLIGGNRIITDDIGGEPQRLPAIAADTTGDFFVVWTDNRNPKYMLSDQYGRMFDAAGIPFAHDFRINDMDYGFYAAIAVNKLGLYVSVWTNDSTNQVYAQRFDRNGTLLGPNFQVSQAPGNTGVSIPEVTALNNGRFIIVWGDSRTFPTKIHGRVLDPLGIPLGAEFTAYIDSMANNYPSCIVDQGDSTFILGMGSDNDTLSIAIQQFDYDANPLYDPIILNDAPASGWYVDGAKGINGYLFIWSRYYSEGSGRHIHGQFLDGNLQRIGSNFLIGDDSTWCQENASVISRDNGEYLVVWQDHRDLSYDIYAQSFDSLGNRIGDNFRIDNDTTNAWQWEPSCVSENDLIYITWTDDRIPAHWFDIYCTVMEWPDLGVSEHKESKLQQFVSFSPNPFRKTLVINLNTDSEALHNSKITIYDITGRLIKELPLPTAYSLLPTVITWDGTDGNGAVVPAGVYFFRFGNDQPPVAYKVVKIK